MQWLEAATDARDRYPAGELTQKDALTIIYVPTKKELLADTLIEYTLGNAGVGHD